MFKTIFTTLMLCTSVGTPLIKQPLKASETYTLYGSYCFRNHFLYSESETEYVGYNETIYTFPNDVSLTDSWEAFTYPNCLHIATGNNLNVPKYRYFPINEMSISHPFDYKYEIHIDSFNVDITYVLDFEYVEYLSDLDEFAYNFIAVFPSPVYVSRACYTMFQKFFTNQGNDSCTLYNGYYTYLTNTTPSFSYNNCYQVGGSMLIDNVLCTHLSKVNTGKIYGYNYNEQIYVYDNGYKLKQNSVLFNGVLINNGCYQLMQQDGSFSYISQTTDYTFTDMIFSVMDAPVYFLSSLFSFELFGIQFYVAFMGIVTVLLVCVVVRKII